ncbi:hypothetical protein CHUUTOTORO_01300 [Serratia phage vB_SmaM-ChuuTotoro]|nr:hypothetical protein CHUUTOTORO_01300 [Serratia phage vB_SmaM-ChuuTotoro]
MNTEGNKPPMPTSYAYEALVQSWEANCIALTIDEAREFAKIRGRVNETRHIDKAAEKFILSIGNDRFIERDHQL